MPKNSNGSKSDDPRSWELSEDAGGLLRPQELTEHDITHVFAEDGTLLTQTGHSNGAAAQDTTPDGGRLGRLLRYYMANAGRRVVLHDGNGRRWPALITQTRWHGKRAGRLWSFRSSTSAATTPNTSEEKGA